MFSELELESYEIYENHTRIIFNEYPNSIEYFIKNKSAYKHYYEKAIIRLRKEKLEKLRKNT